MATLTPSIVVEPDHYLVSQDSTPMTAQLSATFVVCFYDAVHEAGAMVHLRSGPPGRAHDAELTDTTLSSDLLLIDRCIEELRAATPKAQHWQARLLAQVDTAPGARARFEGMRDLLTAFLGDAGVTLISCDILDEPGARVRFDPVMGKAWIATTAG
jgi:chemotaxis receptor (MCP) glutamine deamidase CheD